MTEFDSKVMTFTCMLSNAYKEEDAMEHTGKLEIEDDTLTEDFTAMMYAMYLMYLQITDDKVDIVGFTHILNRLALQRLMEGIEKSEE